MSPAVPVPCFDEWLKGAREAALQPPAQPRHTLVVAGHAVGSVAEGFLHQNCLESLNLQGYLLRFQEHAGGGSWQLDVPPESITPALNALAGALREHGLSGPWRNEQLAVCNASGAVVGTVERGAVRVLGIASRAVHLVGVVSDGRMWVQKRSMDKPNNPGQWDTLMGGMVSAADTLPQALARETWEEAGLLLERLEQLTHGGHVDFSRPSREGGGAGFMRERIDWFSAVVPGGVAPCNQDGEVEYFALRPVEDVQTQVAQGLFTVEAGMVIAGFLAR